jgi:phosphoribosylanthranilate isomerase
VEQVNPYALDVSSGVESKKGVKDLEKIKQFIYQANL